MGGIMRLFQESTQIAYPYIANAQNPVIRNKQTAYLYHKMLKNLISEQTKCIPISLNAQNPFIRNAQKSISLSANAQNPFIRNRQNAYPYH